MTKYESLKNQAKELASNRMHKLGRFTFRLSPNRMVGCAECTVCKAHVTINTNPLPNDIDIGGTAIAVNCKS